MATPAPAIVAPYCICHFGSRDQDNGEIARRRGLAEDEGEGGRGKLRLPVIPVALIRPIPTWPAVFGVRGDQRPCGVGPGGDHVRIYAAAVVRRNRVFARRVVQHDLKQRQPGCLRGPPWSEFSRPPSAAARIIKPPSPPPQPNIASSATVKTRPARPRDFMMLLLAVMLFPYMVILHSFILVRYLSVFT